MTKYLPLVLLAAAGGCADDSPCDPDAPNTICTIVGHTLDEKYDGDNGPATAADISIPMDSVVAPDGSIWLSDFNRYVIRRIDQDGTITTVSGNTHLGDSPASDGLMEIPALQASGNHTPSLTFHDGFLYLPAWHESRIKRIELASMMMTNVAGRATRSYYDGDGGPAMTAAIDLPSSIAFDPQGNLVFMDQGNLVVRRVDPDATIHTIVGQCIIEAEPCSATVQPVQCPMSDKLVCGDVSACDGGASTGGETGNPGMGSSTALCTQASAGDGGPATAARLNMPFTQFADPSSRIAYNHAGDLIIPETGGNRIRKVDHATGIISTIAGTGEAGYAGDDGPATAAQINHPVDVAIADDDSIYFTDVWNHCVRKIDAATGTISAVAGQCHFTPSGEPGSFGGDGGPPLAAQLYKPYGIDLVGGKLYISDSYNNRLRVVNLPE